LRDLLALLEPEGRNLTWSIQDLEAVGDPEKLKTDLLEIEENAKHSPQGLIMKWEELVELAEALKDVWNPWIVGCRDSKLIPKVIYSTEKVDQCEIVIEVFDSSYLRVYARDDEIIRRIAGKFQDVSVTSI